MASKKETIEKFMEASEIEREQTLYD